MKCRYCKAEWNTPGQKAGPKNCPFCGKKLVAEAHNIPETLEDVLLEIVDSCGVDTLKDGRKTLGFFCDLAPQLKKERILLSHFINANSENIESIFAARTQSEAEQRILFLKILNKLIEEWAMREDAATAVCKSYFYAVGIAVQANTIDQQSVLVTNSSALSAAEFHKKGDDCYAAKDYARAVEWYKKAVQEKYVPSQVQLGKMIRDGEGIVQDKVQAYTLFKQAADSGNARAMFYVGRCYEYGDGVPKNLDSAVQWYTQAVKLNDVFAMVNLGACYDRGLGVPKDLSRAFYYYKMAADLNDSLAQNNIGLCYELGNGVEKNYDEAFYWYSLSSEQGEPSGQVGLARCYLAGHGTSQDYSKAIIWLKKAAEQNEPMSFKLLANCYAEGKGVEKDENKALSLYNRAFSQGIASSVVGVLKIYTQRKRLSEQECNDILRYFPEDEYSDREVTIIEKCGLLLAFNMVNYDSTKAVGIKWMQICADGGNVNAQFWLGEAYRTGSELSRDAEKARFWLQKAADQEHQKAKEALHALSAISSKTVHITESSVFSLVREYRLESIYIVKGTSLFDKKTKKAMKAYANINPCETPLLIHDNTVFGSAKEGFILTDKAIYIGGSISDEKFTYPLSQVVKAAISKSSDNSLYYLDLYFGSTSKSRKVHLTYDSEENSVRHQCKFWNKLLGLV